MRLGKRAVAAASFLVVVGGALATTVVSTVPAQAAVGVPQILEGDQGFAVYCVQDAINWSIPEHLSLDGTFGPLTLKGVKDFQYIANLPQIDGQVGPQTGTDIWAAIQDQIDTVGNLSTPYGIPLSHCYQVVPTSS